MMAQPYNHFDSDLPIITRAGTMRTEDVVDGLISALHVIEGYAVWVDSEDTYSVAFDAHNFGAELEGRVWVLQRVEARGEAADDEAEALAEAINEAADFVDASCPEGWWYGVNEHDPAEAGFYPVEEDDFDI